MSNQPMAAEVKTVTTQDDSENQVLPRSVPTPARTRSRTDAVSTKKGIKRKGSKTLFGIGARRRKVSTPSPVKRQENALLGLKTVVITLERRPDRMQSCATRLDARCPGLPYTTFSATDGKLTPIPTSEVTESWHTGRNVVYQKIRAQRKGWDDLDSYQVRQLDLSPGERGCSSSHIRAWRRCLEAAGATGATGNEPLLVLEDDADPSPDFMKILPRALAALPSDAHVLYLGYSQAAGWRREVSAELVEAEYVWTTVAYIIWPAGARILLDHLPVDQPVDNYMANLCAEGTLRSYCVRPKVIYQADAWNTNSDVAHSDEHYWGASSDIHHSDAFYWGNPPAETRPQTDGLTSTASCFWDIDSDDSEDSADDL